MSLFTSIQLANNTLQAAQIGLQVVGNNIANVNTPGYIRQSVLFAPAPVQKIGNLTLGLGVKVEAILQEADRFLDDQVRSAAGDIANGRLRQQAYEQLETILGELSESDLSTSLVNFFSSIHDVLNQPEDIAVRNLAVLAGQSLGDSFERLSTRVTTVQDEYNGRIGAIADDINRLTTEIARLNLQIVGIEAGETTNSDAIGLRDRREVALKELSQLIDIRAVEQDAGDITVYTGGDFLVFGSQSRDVTTAAFSEDGISKVEIRLEATQKAIGTNTGTLGGLVAARDEILGGFNDQLDEIAQALIFEFNQLYSSGQGLEGYTAVTAEHSVDDADAALDAAGLTFTPVNGSLQVLTRNTQTGQTETSDILVRLNGFDDDTTLNNLIASLDAVDGISAGLNSAGVLEITSDSAEVEFAFANDTSGVLAALGVATFFTGEDARTLDVNQLVVENPSTFAASAGGIANDTQTAEQLAAFLDRELPTHNDRTLASLYDGLIAETAQGSAIAKAVADGFEAFGQTLESRQLAISGVSLDEEAVKMIQYQRMYQASARFIRTISDLLDVLVNL